MTYYVCIQNPDEFVRQALQVRMDGLCPGIKWARRVSKGARAGRYTPWRLCRWMPSIVVHWTLMPSAVGSVSTR